MLDQNQIKYLTPEDQQRYREIEPLFATPGWKHLVKWANDSALLARQRALSAPTWDLTLIARAQLLQLQAFADLERQVINDFAAAADQAAEAQFAELSDGGD